MPEVQFAGTRQSEQVNTTDTAAGISHAVVQDVSGRLYDVFISAESKGRKRLHDRARAAWTLQHSKDLAALGFAYDTMLTFVPGKRENTEQNTDNAQAVSTQQPMRNMSSLVINKDDDATVLICEHLEGSARDLRLLTTEDCTNVGTAIGAIHRLHTTFVTRGKYPAFTTGQIRAQLTSWIKRLRQAGHIPTEITDSWSRVLETEGLWSFETCPVHGGFVDGDILFTGSTITAVTNWQNMQINDPARDLAWIFAKLNEQRRNAVLSAYGRMMGSRLDSLIMLRANLWLQMEQVGDFIQALQRADTTSIMRFKAQVERLAHELTRISNAQSVKNGHHNNNPASTITVGSLLENDNTQSRQIAHNGTAHTVNTTNHTHNMTNTDTSDETHERDITIEGDSTHSNRQDVTNEHEITANDSTHEHTVQYTGTYTSSAHLEKKAQLADDTATQVITHVTTQTQHETAETIAQKTTGIEHNNGDTHTESTNNTDDSEHAMINNASESQSIAYTKSESDHEAESTVSTNVDNDKPETVIIPLLEREERAMRDAQADLHK
ncbi:phosphotransferase [Gardnerella vaginalis]|nr:phosphotransferase [Gardnerella vaginalis]